MPRPTATDSATRAPQLVPCMMISRGHVMLPGEEGPDVARDGAGKPLDVLELVDRLLAEYPRVYVVDLDGIERSEPQLDYLQEIARDGDIWVDVGVRNANDVIDALVTGAHRAVLSSGRIRTDRELHRAWTLSPELVFEVEMRDRLVVSQNPSWRDRSPADVAAAARKEGVQDVVVSFRDTPVDWAAVRAIAAGGPTWVGGTFDRAEASKLADNECAGGIFHLEAGLIQPPPPASDDSSSSAR